MNTPDYEIHRAIVHSSNTVTGAAEVRIPSLLGAGQVVNIPTTGLTQVSGYWNVPSPGASTFIAVSSDRTQFLWVTAVTTPSSGDDRDVVDSLQFNIDANITVESEGLLAWNEDWGTVDIGLHGSNAVLHVGQQVYYYAKNQTGAQIDKGTVVRFDGALGASGHIKMTPFLADGTYPSEYIMGITAHDIPDGDDGYVVHFGAVRGVDTSVWTAGDVVYASPTVTGGLTSTPPSAPNNIILVAAVVNSHAQNGELFVRPTLAANILNDEGIVYTNLADNDVLAYNATTGVFENTSSLDLTTLTTTGDVTVGGTLNATLLASGSDGQFQYNNGGAFGGASALYYDDVNSRVGIGTTSPSYKLDVNGTGRFTGDLTTDGAINVGGTKTISAITGSYGSIQVGGEMTWDGYSIDGRVVFMHDGVNTSGIYNDVNNEWMARFILNGAVELYYDNSLKAYTDGSGFRVAGRLYSDSGTSSVDVLEIRNEVQAGNGSASDPSYTFSSDGDTGMYRQTTNSIGFATGGTQHYWNANGIYLASGDWFRTTDDAGWYNQTDAIGIYSTDASWVRLYNGSRTKGFYSNSGRITGYVNASGQSEAERRSWYYAHSFECNQYNGLGIRNVNDAGTVQLRPASSILYIRNSTDGAYYSVAGGTYYTNSSIDAKQDVANWETPKAAGAAINPEEIVDATAVVRGLRPVTYRMKRERALQVNPQDERRRRALEKLNSYRFGKGQDFYDSEELVHQCGRDCENSPDEPCLSVRNWQKGHLGLIAEEAGGVLDLITGDTFDGQHKSIDTYALTTVLVKALQEIDERLATIEGATA